jgi:methionyl-tRNA formyltransferase
LRTVYLGTSAFAAGVLAALAGSAHRPALVVTPPDRPRGRGRRLASPPAAERARELGIDVLQAERVNDGEAIERIAAAAPELGVVCAFGQLIGARLLDDVELLNVHPSLLPRWRGAAPIERAILAGDEQTGVTVMRVTEGLDSGPIALAESTAIGGEDFGSLSARLVQIAGRLIVRALDLRVAGELELREQDDSEATYAEKISATDRRLDPNRPATELERRVRALEPHIGAYLELDGGARLRVRRAAAEPGNLGAGNVAVDGDELRIGCAKGVLRVDELQPPGGRPMSGDAYLRGHPVPNVVRDEAL